MLVGALPTVTAVVEKVAVSTSLVVEANEAPEALLGVIVVGVVDPATISRGARPENSPLLEGAVPCANRLWFPCGSLTTASSIIPISTIVKAKMPTKDSDLSMVGL